MSTKRFLPPTALLTGCLLAAACGATREPTSAVADFSPGTSPEYAVYAAVLDSLFARGNVRPRYVLSDSTVVVPIPASAEWPIALRTDKFGPLLADAVNATLPSFRTRSAERVALRAADLRPRGSVELVSATDLLALRGTGGGPREFWRSFYARFPGAAGSIAVSRVGFDDQGTHALLYVSHGCGALCADGGFVLVERRGERWVVLKYLVTWVS